MKLKVGLCFFLSIFLIHLESKSDANICAALYSPLLSPLHPQVEAVAAFAKFTASAKVPQTYKSIISFRLSDSPRILTIFTMDAEDTYQAVLGIPGGDYTHLRGRKINFQYFFRTIDGNRLVDPSFRLDEVGAALTLNLISATDLSPMSTAPALQTIPLNILTP